MTAANVFTAIVFALALASGLALLLGYYQQRIAALEADKARRSIERDAAVLRLQVEVMGHDKEGLKTQVTQLEGQVADFPRQLEYYRHEAHEANRAFASIAFQERVGKMERDGVPNPTVTLYWIEAEDTPLVDQLAAYFKELAPNWPVKKHRDPGSEARQGSGRRIVFHSTNEELARHMAYCFNRSDWAGEYVEWTDKAADSNLSIWIFPRGAKAKVSRG